MGRRRLYTLTLRASAFDPAAGTSTARKDLERLAQLAGSGTVTPTGTNPADLSLAGGIQGKYADRIATSLRELLSSNSYETFVVYAANDTLPEAGYYTASDTTTQRVTAQYGNLDKFDIGLVQEGTRASHRRAVKTNAKERPHPWGNDTTEYVGVPATATKVQGLNYERDATAAATPVDTVTAEFGDVERYDVAASPSAVGDRPYLVYDLPLAESGNTDAGVWDTYGSARTDADGDFAWAQVFRADHQFRGLPILSNGRLRLRLNETTGLTAERYSAGSWTSVTLGTSDWQLFDVDLTQPGAAQVRARLTFENSTNGNLFDLEAALFRGWDDLLLYSPDNLQVPSGLVGRLDAIAASTVIDPQPERTLVPRSDLR